MAKANLCCPVKGCKSAFGNLWGVKVHYARTHKSPKWRDEWDALVESGQQASPPTVKGQPGFIYDTLVEALQSHPDHSMSIPELTPVFINKGYASSLEALRQGIASATRTHPDILERASRGIYRLRRARVSRSAGTAAVRQARSIAMSPTLPMPAMTVDNSQDGDVSSLRSEVARLRRRAHRQQEVIMVLTRLAMEED